MGQVGGCRGNVGLGGENSEPPRVECGDPALPPSWASLTALPPHPPRALSSKCGSPSRNMRRAGSSAWSGSAPEGAPLPTHRPARSGGGWKANGKRRFPPPRLCKRRIDSHPPNAPIAPLLFPSPLVLLIVKFLG